MLDKLDATILNELIRDSRRSQKDLARAVGSSESTVSKRIDGLVVRGYIERFTIQLDYAKLGYHDNAATLIKFRSVSAQELRSYATKIASSPFAVEVFPCAGDFDLFVRWRGRSSTDIIEELLGDVLDSNNIANVVTSVFGAAFKSLPGPEVSLTGDQ